MFYSQECFGANVVVMESNPYKPGINSSPAALTLFDCDGKELTDVRTNATDSYINFQLPIKHDTQVGRLRYSLHH